MANALKGKVSNTLIWILMGLLVVGLAGFGSVQFSSGAQSVASVGDREIDVNDYARELDAGLRELEAQTGQRLTLEQARIFGLQSRVLAELIVGAALDNETDNIGVSAGDERLAGQVQNFPAFRGADGQFDAVNYRSTLARMGLSAADFEANLRDEMVRIVLQNAIVSGVDAPRAVNRAFVDYLSTARDVSYLILGADDLDAPLAEPDDSTLRAYHSDNADAFFVPQTRAITYAWLTPEMLADDVEVDEAALRSAYDARTDEFNRPERRLVERLVFASADEAADAAARLEAGEVDFSALVGERGLDLADVDLGDVTEASLGIAGSAIFALEDTGVSGVVNSDLGPAIFRLNAILYAQVTEFEQARGGLRQEYALDEARRLIANIAVDADDLLAGGATLEELAAETELTLGTIDYTPASEDGIAANPDFHRPAIAVSEGDFPAIENLNGGGIFALRLDEIREQRPMSFDEARIEVEAAWRSTAVAQALSAQAETMVTQLSGGSVLAELDDGVARRTALTRQDSLPELPAAAVAAIFEMAPGEARVLSEGGEVALVVVDALTPPDLTNEVTAQQSQAVSAQIAQGIAQDIFQLYANALQVEAGISVNAAMIDAVHRQYGQGPMNAPHS